MAATGGDARAKRAQARSERRAKSSTKQASEPRRDEAQQSEPSNGHEENGSSSSGLSTPKLVAAGAAAGALLGTAKAVRDRRHAHEGEHDEHEEIADREEHGTGAREDVKREGGQPAGLRGLLVSVLEAALEAVNEPGAQGRQQSQQAGDEREREEEDDDEEAEREPRDEQSDDGRPAARGEASEAGQREEESGSDAGADEGASGGAATEDQQPPSALSEDADDDDDDDGGRRHEAHRNGGGDAATIVARAREQLAQFVGRNPESISRVEHGDDGWRLGFEVVELPRIPSSTDVMASYAVTVDDSGSVIDYERTNRYYRNRAEGSA